jgi:NAD(P)-dependent dehydrogenase (short-subunit alcohol dehydrogenase family)
MGDLEGRIALITGAAKGLGAATARAMAAEGATVILTDLAAPDALAEELGGHALAHDVTDEAQWVAAMAFARDKAGGLDVLVNNAGLFAMGPITETKLEDWRRIHAVNVEGVFLGCKHAIPLLAERASKWTGGTAIVNLSSVAGIVGTALVSCYNASKGAVRLMTKGVAMEVAPLKIRVNSIHPGIIETDMGQDLVDQFAMALSAGGNETRDQLSDMHPMGHFGVPQNIADAAVFLASDKAAFMTGAELVVDGGMTAR